MALEEVKLSDLSDDTIVSFEGATFVLTVPEMKEFLKKDYEAAEQTWYVVESQTWEPCAQSMLESYIDSEYQEMYEDWDERALDCVTDDVVNKIQAILDEAFKGSEVKNYWTFEKEIELD